MGDGLLVEFASVVDALACALSWQDAVAVHEAMGSDCDRMAFRISVAVGDVIVEGDDIHGDAVNMAARLEGLAEAGGICVSDDAYRQAKGKIKVEFEDFGERRLKNIAEPIRVYRIAGAVTLPRSVPSQAKVLARPNKPSIAVLPLVNMSGDPEQAYFSDGITDDIYHRPVAL